MTKTWLHALAFFALTGAAQADGVYLGLGPAEGMRLRLDGGSGAITTPEGVRKRFDLSAVGAAREGAIDTGGGDRLYIHLSENGPAIEAVLAPLSPEGAMDAGRAEFFPFLKQGTPVPERPLAPPQRGARAIEPRGFVSSFPYWSAAAAARGYALLEPRWRSVIKLFPHVQAELIWRVCRGGARGASVGEALAGQGLSCKTALSAVSRAQSSGKLGRFRDAAAQERRTLLTVLDCGEDLTRTRADCEAASRETSRRALSMETAGTVLGRYR